MGAPDFSAPGTYDVVWVVQGQASEPFRIEVEPTNIPVRVTISQQSRPPRDRMIVTSSKMVTHLVALFPGYESQPTNAFTRGGWPVEYIVDIAFADGHSRTLYVSGNSWTAGAEHFTPIAQNWDELLESMTTNFFKRTSSNMERLDQVHEPTTLILGPSETVNGAGAELQHPASPGPHLSEAQALAIAKPMLPLPAGESYRVHFSNGTWEVWTDSSTPREGWTVVVIQDIDGQAHLEERL
jgi:hypothetical protein